MRVTKDTIEYSYCSEKDNIRAYLNGERIELFISADTIAGHITRYKRKSDGRLVSPVCIETLVGDVEVRFLPHKNEGSKSA